MSDDPILDAWMNEDSLYLCAGETSYDITLSELRVLVARVREDERARIVKTLRNLADHMTNGGLDDKTKEAWVLRWASDLLEAK